MTWTKRREPYRTSFEPAVALDDGVRRLWAAVLDHAWTTVSLRRGSDEERRHLREWVQAERTTPGAFAWICALLELDPDPLRRRFLHPPRRTSPFARTPAPR